MDGMEEYLVLSVEGSQMYRFQLQYLIHWTRYNLLTWEHAEYVDGLQGVAKLQEQYPRNPGPLEVLGWLRTKEGDTVMAQLVSDNARWTQELFRKSNE